MAGLVPSTEAVEEGHRNTHQGLYAENLVRALATAAGLIPFKGDFDDGVDFMLASRGDRGTPRGPRIDVQVKSWRGDRQEDGHWVYRLSNKAYNDLAGTDRDWPAYLFLCVVPGDATDYVVGDHDHLRFHRAAYWCSLRDREPDWGLPRTGRQKILVPTRNLLTVQTLRALVERREHEAVVE